MNTGSLKVYCTNPGSSCRDLFCKEILNNNDYTNSVMVLPTKLTQDAAVKCYSVRCMSLDKLAALMLQENLNVEINTLSKKQQLIVLQSVLAELSSANNLVMFKDVYTQKGYLEEIMAVVGIFARSTHNYEKLQQVLEDTGDTKLKELSVIFSSYRKTLSKNRLYDKEEVYLELIDVLNSDSAACATYNNVYFADFADLHPLEIELIKALSNVCNVKIGFTYLHDNDCYKCEEPTISSLAGSISNVEETLAPNWINDIFLQCINKALGAEKPFEPICVHDCVRVLESYGQDQEIRTVLTEIKNACCDYNKCSSDEGGQKEKNFKKPSDFALIVRSLDDYKNIRKIADEYGLPISLAHTQTLALQKYPQFIQSVLNIGVACKSQEVLARKKQVELFLNLLKTEYGKFFWGNKIDKVDKFVNKKYFKDLQALLCDKDLAEKLKNDRTIQAVLTFINKLQTKSDISNYVALVNELDAEIGLPQVLACSFRAEQITMVDLTLQIAIHKKYLSVLKQLEDDYTQLELVKVPEISLEEFAETLKQATMDSVITLSKGRQDGIKVLNAVQAKGMHWPVVYVLGVREGEFPKLAKEKWLLTENDINALTSKGLVLENNNFAYSKEIFLLHTVVSAAEENLIISYYNDESAERSAFADRIINLFNNVKPLKNSKKLYASVFEALENVNNCPDVWVEEKVSKETVAASYIDNERIVSKGDKYVPINASFDFYGQKNVDIENIVNCQHNNKFSASGLKLYVECPFKYFVERILRYEDIKIKADELEANISGSLIHDTLEEFVNLYLHNKPIDEKLKLEELVDEFIRLLSNITARTKDGGFKVADIKKCKQVAVANVCADVVTKQYRILLGIFNSKVDEYIKKKDIIDNDFWPSKKLLLEELLRDWLKFEIEDKLLWPFYVPVELEKKFTFNSNIKVENGNEIGVEYTGKIDRIEAEEYDSSADVFKILEYKKYTKIPNDIIDAFEKAFRKFEVLDTASRDDDLDKNSCYNKAYVSDYKTGSYPSEADFIDGIDVQIMLYLLATNEGLKLIPQGAGYIDMKKQNHKKGVCWADVGNEGITVTKDTKKKLSPLGLPNWHDIKDFCVVNLENNVKEILNGSFPVKPYKEDSCKYCLAKDICRNKVISMRISSNIKLGRTEGGATK